MPHFYGEESLTGWKRVVEEVHLAGGKIFPQLWHVGLTPDYEGNFRPGAMGPSGLAKPGEKMAEPMTQQDVDAVVRAFGEAAGSAQRLGFADQMAGRDPQKLPSLGSALLRFLDGVGFFESIG